MADYGKSGYVLGREDLDLLNTLTKDTNEFRDLIYSNFSAPEEIDPRPWLRIENQGNMGSCQGHALSTVGEYAFYIATGKVTQFSPLFSYYATQKRDGLLGRDVGSTITGGMQCAMYDGLCPLEIMPYPNPVRYTGKFTAGAYEAAKQYLIGYGTRLRTERDVFNFIASGQGIVEIGIAWNNSMTPRNGVIETYSSSGGGGHAVAYAGYTRRKDSKGRNYYLLFNSWDVSWGVNGVAEVAPSVVEAQLRANYTVMIGLSDLKTPEPRKVNYKQW